MREALIKNGQLKPIIFKQSMKRQHNSNLSLLFNKVNASNDKIFSVELCPNRSLDVEQLESISPAFCSITWHIQSNAVLQDASKIPAILLSEQLSLHGHHVVMHLAGRDLNKSQVIKVLDELQRIDVKNLFVLQGEWSPESEPKSDFPYASDLVKFIRLNYGSYFYIGVAAYAEAHPNSKNKMEDLKFLKDKVDSGADFIITQMIFDFKTFSSFHEECRDVGLNIPIIPGVYVINSYESLALMITFCKVQLPEHIRKVLEANKNHPEAIRNYGIFQCSQLIRDIFLNNSFPINCVHFFSLNRVKSVGKVCKILGLCDAYIERPILNSDEIRKIRIITTKKL